MPSYLIVLSSLALSLYALVEVSKVSLSDFGQAVIIGYVPWVIVLFIGNIITVIGLILRNGWAVKWGAFLSFIMWVFGGIAFLIEHQGLTAVVVILPYLIEYAYLYVFVCIGELDTKHGPLSERL